MGLIVAIMGNSGEGKTTSTIINPDGTYNPDDYKGMDPKSHFIINLDNKPLPFPRGMWEEGKNVYTTTSFDGIKKTLTYIATKPEIKSVALDTINTYLAYKEFNDRAKMSFDQWRELSNDIIELNKLCTTLLRKDQIAYIFAHTGIQELPGGDTRVAMAVTGKKLTKVQPEGFYSIVLCTRVDNKSSGNNRHLFQTRANKSSAKSPVGMFDLFEIPNSLKSVDDTVRKFYNV